MEVQEFKQKKQAYDELLKVDILPLRHAIEADVNSHNFATNIMVPGPAWLTDLLIEYLIKNRETILNDVKAMALDQLNAVREQVIKDVEADLSEIKSII